MNFHASILLYLLIEGVHWLLFVINAQQIHLAKRSMRFCRRSSSFLAFYQFVAVFLVLPMRRILVFSNTSVSPVVAVYERLIKTRCQGAAILQNSIVMSFLKYRSGFIWVPIKMSLLTRCINKCILSN